MIPKPFEWRAQGQPGLWGTPVGTAGKAFPGDLLRGNIPAEGWPCSQAERGGSSSHGIKGEKSGKDRSRAGLAGILLLQPPAVFYGSPKLQVPGAPQAGSKLAAPVQIRGFKIAAAFQRGRAPGLQEQLLIQGKTRVESEGEQCWGWAGPAFGAALGSAPSGCLGLCSSV